MDFYIGIAKDAISLGKNQNKNKKVNLIRHIGFIYKGEQISALISYVINKRGATCRGMDHNFNIQELLAQKFNGRSMEILMCQKPSTRAPQSDVYLWQGMRG